MAILPIVGGITGGLGALFNFLGQRRAQSQAAQQAQARRDVLQPMIDQILGGGESARAGLDRHARNVFAENRGALAGDIARRGMTGQMPAEMQQAELFRDMMAQLAQARAQDELSRQQLASGLLQDPAFGGPQAPGGGFGEGLLSLLAGGAAGFGGALPGHLMLRQMQQNAQPQNAFAFMKPQFGSNQSRQIGLDDWLINQVQPQAFPSTPALAQSPQTQNPFASPVGGPTATSPWFTR